MLTPVLVGRLNDRARRVRAAVIKPPRVTPLAPERLAQFRAVLDAAHDLARPGEPLGRRALMGALPGMSRHAVYLAKKHWIARSEWPWPDAPPGVAKGISTAPDSAPDESDVIAAKAAEGVAFKAGDYADIRPDDGGRIVVVGALGGRYSPRFARFRAPEESEALSMARLLRRKIYRLPRPDREIAS